MQYLCHFSILARTVPNCPGMGFAIAGFVPCFPCNNCTIYPGMWFAYHVACQLDGPMAICEAIYLLCGTRFAYVTPTNFLYIDNTLKISLISLTNVCCCQIIVRYAQQMFYTLNNNLNCFTEVRKLKRYRLLYYKLLNSAKIELSARKFSN